MAITTTYNLTELEDYLRNKRLMPWEFNEALVSGLNEAGNEMTRVVTSGLAESTGFTIATAQTFVTSTPATISTMTYEMRVSLSMIETEKNSQPLPQRGFPAREVREMPDESKMVNLVTMQDGKVCPICEQISKEGPYNIEEFNRLRDVHPHLLNKNLRCRCSLVPFKPEGREPASGHKAHIDLHTAQQDLVQSIRAKTRALIKERAK